MFCCADCFGDRGIRKSIIPLRSVQVGGCSFCASSNIPVLRPPELAEYFELLISAYRPDANGKPLVHWFREDWGMFSHPRMDDSRAGDLLAEILDDGEVVRRAFSPAAGPEADRLGDWERLRDELRHRNRFFPNVDIDLSRLELLLSHLILASDEVPHRWYRARIQTGEAAFQAIEMGAPPRRSAAHGRVNPVGIPYLYLGSMPHTAISEVRPHTGEVVCVAEFGIPDGLKFVDLREPRSMVSPFLLEDAEDVCRMRSDIPFLERLGAELTQPVVPQAAAVEYTPSQYLCEFIKKCGYDGVIYRSSVSDGINMALFNPERTPNGNVAQYRVVGVSVTFAPTEASGSQSPDS